MPLSDFLIGCAYLAGTLGAVGFATAVLRRRLLGGLAGAPLVLALAVLFTALLVAVHLLPLALGILSRPAVLVAAVLAALAVTRVRAADAPPGTDAAPPRGGAVSWALATIALTLVGAEVVAFVGNHATQAVLASDFTTFHLPGIARWIQSGTLWHSTAVIPDFAVGAYPNNGDLVFLAAVLPWHSDAFVRLVNVPFLLLSGVAVYAIARELRTPRATAALMGSVFISTETVLITALDRVKPEPMMLATLGGGALFLVRHVRTRSRIDLLLAGLGLGLAFGARWNGATSVLVIVVVFATYAWLRARQLRSSLVLTGVVALAGGFWLLRNLVLFGDPVFPAKVRLLGTTVFGAPYDYIAAHYDYTVAGYLTNGTVLRDAILPAYRLAFGLPGILVAIGALLTLALAIRRRLPSPSPAPALAVAAIASFAVYLLTPGSAQGFKDAPWAGIPAENARWAGPALLLAAALTAWVAARLGRGWRHIAELAGVIAVIDGLVQSGGTSASQFVAAALALCLLVFAGRLLWRAVRRRPTLRIAGAAILAVVVIAAAYDDQRRFSDRRYVAIDPTIDWIRQHAPSGHRVGIAGAFSTATGAQILAAFGPRFGNRVAYVGYDDGGFLRQYHLQAAFTRELRRGRYDLMLVGRGVPPRAGSTAERWTRAAGFAPVAASAQWLLLREVAA